MQNKYARERCPPPTLLPNSPMLDFTKSTDKHGAECFEDANSSNDIAVAQQYKAPDLKE